MATEKQIAANRENAKHSTGPRTPEGKAITRLNAKRDGLTGQVTTLSDEDRPIFEKLTSSLIADLAPKTVMELNLAGSIAWDTWRLNHLRAVEMNMYALGSQRSSGQNTENQDVNLVCDNPPLNHAMADARTFSEEASRFALMSIYEQRMNRSLQKNLATLRELQAERRQHEGRNRDEEVILARYCDIKGLTYQAPAASTPNGSVFANEEIFAAANRFTTLEVAKKALRSEPVKVQFAGASSTAPFDVLKWPRPEAA
jgi:hypothetical protein